MLRGVGREELLRERLHVLAALAQRRDVYAHDVEAVEEVFAERAPPHGVVQVDVRQRQEPRVHAHRPAPA